MWQVQGMENGPVLWDPPGHPILLICASEEEKPVSCDALNNSKSVLLSTVNRLSQTYQVLVSGDGVCVISGMQEFWMCRVCGAAWLQWKGNGSVLQCGSWQRTLTSLCSKLVRENCGLNMQVSGHKPAGGGEVSSLCKVYSIVLADFLWSSLLSPSSDVKFKS